MVTWSTTGGYHCVISLWYSLASAVPYSSVIPGSNDEYGMKKSLIQLNLPTIQDKTPSLLSIHPGIVDDFQCLVSEDGL